MNRALRAAAIGVLLIAPVTLSACSSGQVNQTTGQARDIQGATARIGAITLRGMQLAFPPSGTYAAGDDAVLNGAIINDGATDTLVSISGDGFTGVAVTGTGAQAGSPTGTATTSSAATSTSAATSSSATSSSATTTGAPTTSGATTSAAPTTTGTTPSSVASSTAVGIEIPAHSVVLLGQNAPHLALTGLTRSIDPAQFLRLTVTFQNAGTVTLDVPVGSPTSPLSKSSTFNFHESGSGGSSANAGSNG